MGYKLWLPGDPEPGTDGQNGHSAPATRAARATRPNAEEVFLTKIAPALRGVVDRLLPVLADQWAGAPERIQRLAPSVLAAIDAAEENVAQAGARFMAGTATEGQFLAAVSEYEAAWRRGAEIIERAARVVVGHGKKEGSA